jgi:hypothetical protein
MPASEQVAFAQLSQAIQSLVAIYKAFENDLNTKPLLDRRGIAVSDAVKEELILRVHEWSEWTTLFNKVKDGTIILNQPSKKAPPFDGVGKLDSLEAEIQSSNRLATRSEDFYPAFEQTLKELEVFTCDRIQQAVKDQIENLSVQVSSAQQILTPLLTKELRQPIYQHFGQPQLELFDYLCILADPHQCLDSVLEVANVDERNALHRKLPALFPLAQADATHKIGQTFDWGDKKHKTPPRPINHQIAVLRIRSEIVSSAGLQLVQLVGEVTKQVNQALLYRIDEISKLQELLKQEALLRYIAGGELQPSPLNFPWLRLLWQIAAISAKPQ